MSVPPYACALTSYFAAVALPDAADASGVLRGSILNLNVDETGLASPARATLVRFACSENISRSGLCTVSLRDCMVRKLR
ncbi:hypothetical protein FIBSPDRAFT_867960 [Athelia psychrophila]|uniref:Uncharacterized protein n=1 Tax=Athelia psychrophila TaxID=1759441 RepID=A0A166DKX9_9AGAM|nr:hypothetical protein FIBSPDRAFT_867960 [Fibularhizoctonia sp. CBS 109695]